MDVNIDKSHEVTPENNKTVFKASFVWILGLAGFISAADNWIVSPILPAIATSFGVSIALAGVIFTAYMVPYGFMQPVYGFISDKHGKSRVLQKIVLGFALGTLACAFASSLWMLSFCRAVTGFFAAGIIALSLAWIGDNADPSKRQVYVGKFMGIVFLGQGVSVGLGGVLVNYVSWRVTFIAFALTAIIAGMALQRLPEKPFNSQVHRKFFREVKHVVSTPKGKIIFPLAFATGFLLLGLYSYLGAFLHEVSGLNYLQVGLVVMFYGFACLAAGLRVGKLGNMWGWQKVVLLGSCSALTSVMLLIFCPFWQAILLATIALGFGYIFIQSPLATIAFDVAPESKGLPSALIGLGLFGGGGLGTAFCGWLLQIGGYRTLWFIIMVGIAFFTLTVTRLDLDFGKKSDLKI